MKQARQKLRSMMRGPVTGGTTMPLVVGAAVAVYEADLTADVRVLQGDLTGQTLYRVPLRPYALPSGDCLVALPSIIEGENLVAVQFADGRTGRPLMVTPTGAVDAILLRAGTFQFEFRRSGNTLSIMGLGSLSIDGGGAAVVLSTFLQQSYLKHRHLTPYGPTEPPMPQYLQNQAQWVNSKVNIKPGE